MEEVDTERLAESILSHASEARNEEELKIRVEATIRPILAHWNINWASYEHRHAISGRKDALYGSVIIEYKAPGKLDSPAEFKRAKEQVKQYIQEQSGDANIYGRFFGIVLDGFKISFVRYRKETWEEQSQPLQVNAHTVLRLLEAIRGLRRKPLDAELLLLDFGPKSEVSRQTILALYDSLTGKTAPRTNMLFADWRRVFSQVCSYSVDKFAGLVDYYPLGKKPVDVEKLLFAIHTYYTILMKLLTSEIVTLFADSILGSYLKRVEEAYYKDSKTMLEELKDLEEGGIFATVGIRNFLEADYFAWYLDEWNEKTARSIFTLTQRLLEYEPATVELNPERVKDLFKRLYQNLVPRDIRHRIGEYFTPDWLAELLLDEVGYDGNPENKVLDPACGSGTFLVLVIRRIREYAEEHFIDERSLVSQIIQNVQGIDLNPLAVLASKANYLIALSDLIRYRPKDGIDIPIYLADSISVVQKTTVHGEQEYELQTNEGRFWVTKEVIDKNFLYSVLHLISEGLKVGWTKEQFESALSPKVPLSRESVLSFIRLFDKIRKLESVGKNRIWTSLLKNSFSPMLMGKFDYVVGNPPWVNWSNLPKAYRDATSDLWTSYGLVPDSSSIRAEVKKDVAMLFITISVSRYLGEDGKLAFLVPFTFFKTQAGGGLRTFITNKARVTRVHDLVELAPFEGAVNRTALLVIVRGKTTFPVSCTSWKKNGKIEFEASLNQVKQVTESHDLSLVPSGGVLKPETPWLMATGTAIEAMRKAIGQSGYEAHSGVDTGLNSVFWVDVLEHRDNLTIIRNKSAIGKKKVKELTTLVESQTVYPLMRGRDMSKWAASPSGHILLLHQLDGAPIKDEDAKVEYPRCYEYFLNFTSDLKLRSTFRLMGKGDPLYAAHKIGKYTFAPYKVVWKEVAGKISGKAELSVAVISAKDDEIERPIVCDHKLMLIPFNTEEEANYVAALLNSSVTRLIVASYTIETAIDTHILRHIRVPKFDPSNPIHLELSNCSRRAHNLAKHRNDGLAEVEEQIDQAVSKLYGLTAQELRDIKRSLVILIGERDDSEQMEED